MSSSPRRNFSTANPSQPGASIHNPLCSAGVLAHPNEEHFYVLDLAQGVIQVISHEAQDYREIGHPVFDSFGNRVRQFDAAHQAAVLRHAEADQADAFYSQYDHVWEIIEMREAMAEATADESIHYNFETGRWYKLKKSTDTPTGKPKKSDKRSPPGTGSPGASGGATSSTTVTAA